MSGFGRLVGNSDRWVMNPVIRGAEISNAAAVDVSLSAGDVTLPDGFSLGQFSATLLPAVGDSSRVTFTDGDGDGVFGVSFEFLMPGDGPFDVRLNGPTDLDFEVSPGTPVTVAPVAGETSVVDWVLLEASDGSVICGFWVCSG